MKYSKPEIVLHNACAAIQSITKSESTNDAAHQPSVTAYEADE